MTINQARPRFAQQSWLLLAIMTFIGVGLGYILSTWVQQRRVAEVARKGAQVMPFDLDRTTHRFKPLDDGGLQTVTVKNEADRDQVTLIQAHLQSEATKFRSGDFSDPASIHGVNMPGLAELRQSAGKIEVRYDPLPNGAQIRYTTSDHELIDALHTWFTAQISDHGKHAMPAGH